MPRIIITILIPTLLLLATPQLAQAQEIYTVPIDMVGTVYTLTVTVEDDGISVESDTPIIRIGEIKAVQSPETLAAQQTLDEQKAQSVTIAYDDLFRNNEKHIGKIVRYVGEVLQVQENFCLFCENPGYTLRVAVTKGDFDLWDDPIWVDYFGDERFLEDDIVTIWGTVEGLKSYQAVLGNQITVPQLTAIDIQLGEVANPQPATPATSAADSTAEDTGSDIPAMVGDSPTANRNANLRAGPGTTYAVVGSIRTGDALVLVARNADGSWLQLASGEWIAAFLVANSPRVADLPLADDIPEQPTPAPTTQAAATPQPTTATTTGAPANNTAPASSNRLTIGEEIEANGWRFKVSEIHKRKAVYFYDNSRVAMGNYLVVVIDATNLQSGTDYFARNLDPEVTDAAGTVFRVDGSASGYAQWQYGGISSVYTDVNPGNFVRIALAVDLPETTGAVLLRTDSGHRIDLGDFSALQVEDGQ